MRQADFELHVTGATATQQEDVVRLEHGKPFTLVLSNFSAVNCDVAVKIDGREIGVWNLDALSSVEIDHAEGDTSPFCFVCRDSLEDREGSGLFHYLTGWIMAFFVPHANDSQPSAALAARGVKSIAPKFSTLALYDGDKMACLEVLMECEPIPEAEVDILPFLVVLCPECRKASRVPEGLGHVRIRCPFCDHRFVRKV